MSKWVYLGGLCWVISGVLVLFQFIGHTMREDYDWKMMSISDVVDYEYLSWIEKIDIAQVQTAIQSIVDFPLYLLLLILGGIFFLLSIFHKGR